MDALNLDFFPLHTHERYIEECANLINEEWPRSNTLRLRSLRESSDALPTSLILVMKEATDVKVIGHSRLKRFPSDLQAVFIESVIICKNYRGKGLGRKLMLETELYAKSLGFMSCFLTAIDKVQFYEKLGYELTKPVQLYGCYMPKICPVNKISSKLYSGTTHISESGSIIDNINSNITAPTVSLNNNIPLPPPLPILPNKRSLSNGITPSRKTYMRKLL